MTHTLNKVLTYSNKSQPRTGHTRTNHETNTRTQTRKHTRRHTPAQDQPTNQHAPSQPHTHILIRTRSLQQTKRLTDRKGGAQRVGGKGGWSSYAAPAPLTHTLSAILTIGILSSDASGLQAASPASCSSRCGSGLCFASVTSVMKELSLFKTYN